MRKITMAFTFAALAMLAACNTMEGAGEDLQVGGKKLERAADEHKGSDSRGY